MKKIKIKNLDEKDIQKLKQIKIIELEEMKLQDLKILKVKIEIAIKSLVWLFFYIYLKLYIISRQITVEIN